MSFSSMGRLVALALALALGAAAQTVSGKQPHSPQEAAALQELTKQFNDATTGPGVFDAAIANFRQQFPKSQYTLPVLLLAVRYHRNHSEYLPLLRYGTTVLEMDPHNVYTLSSLGQAIPNNVKDSDLDRDQRLGQAAGYDREVIAVVDGFLITEQGLDYGGNHFNHAQALTLRNNLAGPAYLSLGHIAMLHQQYPEAMAAYQKALPFEPLPAQQAQIYYDIGSAASAAHQAPEAQAALAKAKELAANSPFLLRMIQTELDKLAAGGGQ